MLRLRVDADHSTRAVVIQPIPQRRPHILGGKRSRLLHRFFPQVDEAPGWLHRVARDAIEAKLTAKVAHPLPVGGQGQALEITRHCIVPSHVPGEEVTEFILGDARGNNGNPLRVDARGGEIGKESEIAVAVDGVENAIGLGVENRPDSLLEIALPQRQIPLAHSHHRLGFEILFDDIVRSAGIDIVGAEKKNLPPQSPFVAQQPVDRRQNLLVGHRPAIDHLRG